MDTLNLDLDQELEDIVFQLILYICPGLLKNMVISSSSGTSGEFSPLFVAAAALCPRESFDGRDLGTTRIDDDDDDDDDDDATLSFVVNMRVGAFPLPLVCAHRKSRFDVKKSNEEMNFGQKFKL